MANKSRKRAPKQAWQLTAVIEREGKWYVALCPELDVASQGKTIEEDKSRYSPRWEGTDDRRQSGNHAQGYRTRQ